MAGRHRAPTQLREDRRRCASYAPRESAPEPAHGNGKGAGLTQEDARKGTGRRARDALRQPASGPLAQRLRLGAGLVLFTFVLTHFLNHALGNVSLHLASPKVHPVKRNQHR